MRVCLIDDDDLLRAVVAEGLRSRGMSVFHSPDSSRAADFVAGCGAAVAVVDVLMPGTDGLEVIADIRQRLPHVQTIVISGGGRLDSGFYLNAARDLGADAVLAKPIDIGQLADMIMDVGRHASRNIVSSASSSGVQ